MNGASFQFLTFLIIVIVWSASAQEFPLELVVQTGHQSAILSMDVSDDGKYLVSGDDRGEILLWDISTAKQLRRISQTAVNFLDFSPDGRFITSVNAGSGVVYDAATGKEVLSVQNNSLIYQHKKLLFNETGTEFLVVTHDSIRVFGFPSGKQKFGLDSDNLYDDVKNTQEIVLDDEAEAAYYSLSFTDARFLDNELIISTKQTIHRIDRKGITNWRTSFASDSCTIKEIEVSGDGHFLCVNAAVEKGSDLAGLVMILSTGDGRVKARRDQAKYLHAARLSADGRFVLLITDDERPFVWDLKQKGVTFDWAETGAISKDGKYIFLDGSVFLGQTDEGNYISVKTTEMFSAVTGEHIRSFGGQTHTPNLVTIVSSGARQDLLWQLLRLNSDMFLWDFDLPPAMNGTAFGSFRNPVPLIEGGVTSWREVGSGSVLRKFDTYHPHEIFYEDEKGSFGKHTKECVGHWAPIAGIKNSGSYMLSWDIYRRWLLWSFEHNKELRQLKLDYNEFVVPSPDGVHFATTKRGKVSLWEFATGKKVKTFGAPGKKTKTYFEESKRVQFTRWYGYHMGFSENGRLLWKYGDNRLKCWDVEKRKEKFEIKFGPPNFFLEGAASSPDGRKIITWTKQDIYLIETEKGAVLNTLDWAKHQNPKDSWRREFPQHFVISPNGKFAAAIYYRDILLGNLNSNEHLWSRQTYGDVVAFFFSNDGRFTISRDFGSFFEEKGARSYQVRETETDSLVVTCQLLGGEAFALVTPDGYYAVTKTNIKNMHFVQGLKHYTFENFDLIFNRPDIILQRLGSSNKTLIQSYRTAYLKRLKKMGFEESDIAADAHLPEVSLETSDLPDRSKSREVVFSVLAEDAKYKLDRINVFVNDVPVGGVRGFSVADLNLSKMSKEFRIKLSKGPNKLQVSTHNKKGAESLKQTVQIEYLGGPEEPDLFVLAIGVSAYQQTDFNLSYAAKDAHDIADHFKNASNLFANIHTMTITDEEATADRIKKAKEFLMQSTVDDQVIVFVAGHGLVGSDFDYYFATHDVDFFNPAEKGLPYEEIELLVDGISARKKLILMDTCHSGEIDKEDVEIAAADNTNVKSRSFRGIGLKSKLGALKVNNLLKDVFADLRRGTGAMVITSSSGDEFSYEDDKWENGVFTYSFLEGLKEEKAGKMGGIKVSQIQDYVVQRVQELTNGRQTPTMRRENLEYDFVVY